MTLGRWQRYYPFSISKLKQYPPSRLEPISQRIQDEKLSTKKPKKKNFQFIFGIYLRYRSVLHSHQADLNSDALIKPSKAKEGK